MPRKAEVRGKVGQFYDQVGYGINSTVGLERSIAALRNIAPQVSAKAGLTAQDIATVKRIHAKFQKLNSWMYSHSEQKPITAEDIK